MSDAPTVSVAVADTRHFDFIATGNTPAEARAALLAGWAEHARQTGADPDYLTEDAINIVTGRVGQAWRDYSPLLPIRPACVCCGRHVAPLGEDQRCGHCGPNRKHTHDGDKPCQLATNR